MRSHISCPISRKPSKRNEANAVALPDLSRHLDSDAAGPDSRDSRIAHGGQDLELGCVCELIATEMIPGDQKHTGRKKR